MGTPHRRLSCLAFVAVIAAAATAAPASAAGRTTPKSGLTGKERRAIQIRSVEAGGDESLGILVTAKFAGNITDLIGRGHLTNARAELVLNPVSRDFGKARIATERAGLIGRTVAKTASKDVGVVRNGRTLTFYDFGAGYSNVATAEVRVVVPSGRGARAIVPLQDKGPGPVAVPQGTPSCAELTDSLSKVEAALKSAQEAKAKAESLHKGVEKLLKDIDNGALVNKINSLITEFENWKYSVKQTTTDEGVANLKKSRGDLEKQIKEINGTIADLEAQRTKLKERLALCKAAPPPPPPPCTASLERSPGTPPYTANNHLRVRATCTSAIRKVNVQSLSGDTFVACAQTAGTATGCNASGATLTSTWNQAAGQQLELYGRVAADSDGNYQVTILGDNDAVLYQFQAAIPAQ